MTPVMMVDPSGNFAITLGMILIGMAISGGIGATVSLGITVYQDYKDDGEIFNNSIEFGEYFGNTLSGAISGAGIGVATVLGMGVGAAVLGGTALTVLGTSLSFGAAFSIGVGISATSGGLGYLSKTLFSGNNLSYEDLIIESSIGAFYGSIGFIVGMAGGFTGYRPLSIIEFSTIVKRTIIEGIFTWPMKGIISTIR